MTFDLITTGVLGPTESLVGELTHIAYADDLVVKRSTEEDPDDANKPKIT